MKLKPQLFPRPFQEVQLLIKLLLTQLEFANTPPRPKLPQAETSIPTLLRLVPTEQEPTSQRKLSLPQAERLEPTWLRLTQLVDHCPTPLFHQVPHHTFHHQSNGPATTKWLLNPLWQPAQELRQSPMLNLLPQMEALSPLSLNQTQLAKKWLSLKNPQLLDHQVVLLLPTFKRPPQKEDTRLWFHQSHLFALKLFTSTRSPTTEDMPPTTTTLLPTRLVKSSPMWLALQQTAKVSVLPLFLSQAPSQLLNLMLSMELPTPSHTLLHQTEDGTPSAT